MMRTSNSAAIWQLEQKYNKSKLGTLNPSMLMDIYTVLANSTQHVPLGKCEVQEAWPGRGIPLPYILSMPIGWAQIRNPWLCVARASVRVAVVLAMQSGLSEGP
jgi:hypothetical protein